MFDDNNFFNASSTTFFSEWEKKHGTKIADLLSEKDSVGRLASPKTMATIECRCYNPTQMSGGCENNKELSANPNCTTHPIQRYWMKKEDLFPKDLIPQKPSETIEKRSAKLTDASLFENKWLIGLVVVGGLFFIGKQQKWF